MPDLGDPEGRAELDRVIKQCEPDLIILDSISTLVRSGTENEAESWAPLQDWLLKHRWQGRTILLVHHEGRLKGKPRGTSKREDPLDTMIGLQKVVDESTNDESVFDLTFTKTRDFFGDAAAPMRLHLSVVDDRVTWRHEQIKDVRREQIREMLAAKMTHDKIAKELGISRSRVSQIAKDLKAA